MNAPLVSRRNRVALPLRPAAAVVALATALLAGPAAATSAVLIPAGELALRQDLEWLADRGLLKLSTTTWPLTVAAVETALASSSAPARGNSGDLARLERLRAAVARLSRPAPTIIAGIKSANERLPHGFADEPRGEQQLSAQTTLAWGNIAVSLQGNAVNATDYADNFNGNADGSYLGVTVFGQLLSIGKVDRYWGPTHEGSTLLGNAARPLAAVALQRAAQTAPESAWLAWIGPWTYQVFFGGQDSYAAVPHTKVFGMRLTLEPLEDFEIGLQRTMQWGGEGRPEDAGSFWDAVIGKSNTNDHLSIDEDPANQLGGFDLRWSRPFGLSGVSLYWQMTGDDEAGGLPSRNVMTGGLAYSAPIGDTAVTWRLESADTRTDRYWGARDPAASRNGYAYTSNIYADGYYERGLPLAYPIGGAGQLYKLGAEAVTIDGLRYGFSVYHLEVNDVSQAINHAYPQADKINAARLELDYPFAGVTISGRVLGQDSDRHGTEVAGIAMLKFDLETLFNRR